MEYSTQNDILQPILENGIEGFSEVLQKMLNLAMKLEREKVLKASPYQRTEGRTGYANGFKERHIQTRMGDLVDIFYYFFCNFIKYFNFCWIFFMKWLSTTKKTGLEPIGG